MGHRISVFDAKVQRKRIAVDRIRKRIVQIGLGLGKVLGIELVCQVAVEPAVARVSPATLPSYKVSIETNPAHMGLRQPPDMPEHQWRPAAAVYSYIVADFMPAFGNLAGVQQRTP